jgi:hypothetical protein
MLDKMALEANSKAFLVTWLHCLVCGFYGLGSAERLELQLPSPLDSRHQLRTIVRTCDTGHMLSTYLKKQSRYELLQVINLRGATVVSPGQKPIHLFEDRTPAICQRINAR